MERQFYCYIVLPLQEIVLRKVVAYLWNETIYETIWKLRDVWNIFEGKVKENISNLKLPRLMKNRMMTLVKPIGSDILNWQVYHEDNFVHPLDFFNVQTLQYLQRTCTGLIDYRRTAEELIRHEVFRVKKRFELACLYCLEDMILLLWSRFSKEDRDDCIWNVFTSSDEVRSYWAYRLGESESLLYRFLRSGERPPFYLYAFGLSARKGNKSATEYFFHKLAQINREPPLLDIFFLVILERFRICTRTNLYFSAEKASDVLCYLLSEMTSEQRMQALEKYHHYLLICLLDWQLESIFFHIADLCWTFLPEKDYGWLLGNMWKFIFDTGYYIPIMFQNFFLSSPRNFRKFFVERECRTCKCLSIFAEFLRAEDTETIKIVFKNIDAEDRESLFLSETVCKYLIHFILSGSWNLVEVCIQAAELSEDKTETLEEGFRYYARNPFSGIPPEWRRQKMRGYFEELFNKMRASSKIKRRPQDDDSLNN